MRVGLDGYPLSEPLTGVGHYTLELARALARNFPADEFELVSPKPFERSVCEPPDAVIPPNLKFTRASASALRGHWWSVGLPLYAKRARFDLFHGTNFEIPLWRNRQSVLTIHDLSTLLFPETHRNRAVRRARLRLPMAAKLAAAVITPTESVKLEVCRYLKIRAAKISAIHEAPRTAFHRVPLEHTATVRDRLGIEDEFVLFVGTLEPRKNLATLVRAFEEVCRNSSLHPQLVLAGGEGWLMRGTISLINSAAIKDRVRLTGYLHDADLRALYSSARVFVYPSLYEGFGLPPLEAMACGAPVVASRIAALQETLGEAAILVEPLDANTLARTINHLLENAKERQRLSNAAIDRATQFSWDTTAQRTHDVYKRVLSA